MLVSVRFVACSLAAWLMVKLRSLCNCPWIWFTINPSSRHAAMSYLFRKPKKPLVGFFYQKLYWGSIKTVAKQGTCLANEALWYQNISSNAVFCFLNLTIYCWVIFILSLLIFTISQLSFFHNNQPSDIKKNTGNKATGKAQRLLLDVDGNIKEVFEVFICK